MVKVRENGIFKEQPRKGKKGTNAREEGWDRKKDRMKILFWNMAGTGNKNKDWWRYIIGFDFVSVSETWLDEKGWKIWKKKTA